MNVLFAFIVCLVASTIGGICGVGGGVIIKPLLDATGMMSVSAVSFLSGLTVLSMSLISVWKNRKTRELDMHRSVPLGLGAAIGGVVGKRLFEMLKSAAGADDLVGALQAVVLGLMVLGTLIYVCNKARIITKNISLPAVGVGIGLMLGVCSSFLGIGGGPMNLAVLYYFYSMSTKKAAVNSILIILISQTASLLVSLTQGSIPEFSGLMLACMVGAGALGGFLSSKFQKKFSAKTTDRLFVGLMIVIIIICCYNAATRF